MTASKNIMMKYLVLIITGLMLVFAFEHAYSDPPLPTPVGRVVWVKGEAFKAIMENKEERLLKKTSVIYLHDLLTTDANTQAEIVFTDNTLITFQPDTKFSVAEYSLKGKDKKTGSIGKSIMNLLEGGFRTITGLIAKNNPSDYAIHTPVATIGVRGTDYTVQLKGGELFIGYKTGQPCVTSANTLLCLDSKKPFARVASSTTAPEALAQKPEALPKQDIEITPARIAGFGSTSSGSGGGSRGGAVTSFCISQ